jgi:poly(3-hydroxybutyrate) depolymerase
MHRALYRVALVALLWGATLAGAADALPALQADARRTTVSGLSSGGFMAVRYAVAFSASVQGVGVVAGGPYRCAVTVG